VTDQPAVIPAQDSLIGDLLSMDISAPTVPVPATTSVFSPPSVDLLGGGLDSLVGFILILLTLKQIRIQICVCVKKYNTDIILSCVFSYDAYALIDFKMSVIFS
jgi:hypothetical protein